MSIKQLLHHKMSYRTVQILLAVWFLLYWLVYLALIGYAIYDFLYHRDVNRIVIPGAGVVVLRNRKVRKVIYPKL